MSTIGTLTAAYRDGTTSPVDVVEAILAANPTAAPWHAFRAVDAADVRAQATDSASRLANRSPRGPLEGIPVGIKDFVAVKGYESFAGTRDLRAHGEVDALLVSRLRDAGAIILGKTHTTELGLSPTGINASQATPVNPHVPDRLPGGSSSGTGAAVAAGLTPAGVGSDGGGSIRIPSALCGLFGIKPSWGLVPAEGVMSVGWWSVDHLGPLARCAEDLATMLSVMADAALDLPTEPLRFGVDWSWWGQPDPAIDAACRAVVAELEPTSVTVDHVGLSWDAGSVTILCELVAGMYDVWQDEPERLGDDVKAQFTFHPNITGVDYVRAQQARQLLAESFERVFATLDVLVVPTTAILAPPRPSEEELQQGLVDRDLIEGLTAYTFAANLCGLPAASVPVGTTPEGLPIGLQLVGRRGADATVLAACSALERAELAAAPTPADFLDLSVAGQGPTTDPARASRSS